MYYRLYPNLLFIDLKLPFKHDFNGDLKKELIINIKIFQLKNLQKEVGHLLKKPKIEPEVKKEQTVETKGFKKL